LRTGDLRRDELELKNREATLDQQNRQLAAIDEHQRLEAEQRRAEELHALERERQLLALERERARIQSELFEARLHRLDRAIDFALRNVRELNPSMTEGEVAVPALSCREHSQIGQY
jgi:hypothetical protein